MSRQNRFLPVLYYYCHWPGFQIGKVVENESVHETISASNTLQQNACGRIIEERLRTPGKAPGTGQKPANDIMAQDGQASTYGPHDHCPTDHQYPQVAQPLAQPLQPVTQPEAQPRGQPVTQRVAHPGAQHVAQPVAQHSHACYDACTHEAHESPIAQRAANALIELVAILILDVFLLHTPIESEQQPVA